MATPIQNERAQAAWTLLLAALDMDAKGISTGIAQVAGVTRRTVSTMKVRLRQLRAEGRTFTGTWAEEMRNEPRPSRPPKASRCTAEEKIARKPSRRAEELEAEKAEALALRRQMIARKEAEAAAWRQKQAEARAAREALALLPLAERRRKVIVMPPRSRDL